MISVKEIQTNNNVVPNNPGYYKWYCEERDYDIILDNLGVSSVSQRKIIKEATEKKENRFCIYLGIANKSLKQRICNMHLNPDIQRSTLRWSISAVFDIDSKDEPAISNKMKDLYVDWTENESPLAVEESLINDSFKILNGAKNHHQLNKIVSKKRRELRNAKKWW